MARIKIDRATYQHFYEALRASFFKNEYPDGMQKGRNSSSQYLWDKPTDGPHKFRILEIVNGCTSDSQYFRKKNDDFKTSRQELVEAEIIGRALLYLNFELDEELKRPTVSWTKKAHFLLDQFRADAGVFVEDSALTLGAELDHYDIEAAKQCVFRFFDHIALGEITEAYDLLTDSYKKANRIDDFIQPFSTECLRYDVHSNISLAATKEIGIGIIKCVVIYQSRGKDVSGGRLNRVQDLTLNDLEQFVSAAQLLRMKYEHIHKTDIGLVPLRKLFDTDVLDFIADKHDLKNAKDDRLDATTSYEIYRVVQCYCMYEEYRWQIFHLNHFGALSSRTIELSELRYLIGR